MKNDKRRTNFTGYIGALLAILATAAGCSSAEWTHDLCDQGEVLSLGGNHFVTRHACLQGGAAYSFRQVLHTNSELWVLEGWNAIPQTPDNSMWSGAFLNDPTILHRSQAHLQINGFTFDCEHDRPYPWDDPPCYDDSQERAFPATHVLESTHPISRNTFDTQKYPVHPLSFGSRIEGGLAIDIGMANADPRFTYNAVNNNYLLVETTAEGDIECGDWEWDQLPQDVTAIGYGVDPQTSLPSVIMAYFTAVWVREACEVMKSLGATNAVLMDGSESAGIYLKDGTTHGHIDERLIPYRIGLVTLEEQNRVRNAGFETPDLYAPPSETPPGYHSYSGDAIRRDVLWDGAMFLYNTPINNLEARRGNVEFLPSLGAQIAAIRTRKPNDGPNYIAQELEVPADRYCMLHFFHGYNNSNSPECPNQSTLAVETKDLQGNRLTRAEYHSQPTIGQHGRLNEVWLRLLTPSDGELGLTRMKLFFTAERENTATPGNCEVLLDDVSVHCVE